LKFDKNSTYLLCFVFQFGGLVALFGGLSHQSHPVATGLLLTTTRHYYLLANWTTWKYHICRGI